MIIPTNKIIIFSYTEKLTHPARRTYVFTRFIFYKCMKIRGLAITVLTAIKERSVYVKKSVSGIDTYL